MNSNVSESAYYDNVDHHYEIKDITGGIRYMPINKESVGKPDYQPLQQNNNSDKTLQQITRNQKRIIAVTAILCVLFLIAIVVGSILVSITWSKLNTKVDYFQKCQLKNTSCTLTRSWPWLYSTILPNCTTGSMPIHMKVSSS